METSKGRFGVYDDGRKNASPAWRARASAPLAQSKCDQMALKLETVIPFGRSMAEYRKMFALSDTELNSKKIVGVGDGPASFNAEMFGSGKTVVSVDPVYAFGAREIERQFHSVLDNVMAQVRSSIDDWVWTYHKSPEHLRNLRIGVMKTFVDDYENGKAEGRYVIGGLPVLGSKKRALILPCAPIFYLLTPSISRMSFTGQRFRRCSVSRLRPASSRS